MANLELTFGAALAVGAVALSTYVEAAPKCRGAGVRGGAVALCTSARRLVLSPLLLFLPLSSLLLRVELE